MPKTGHPKLEDGYARIANELLEALVGYPFSGGELRVVLAIVRRTYGWNRTRCLLRQTTLARLTRLHDRQIQRILISLRRQGVLFRDRSTRPFTYELNTAYLGWREWPCENHPDAPVRFPEGGCELSPEPDSIAAARPDINVRLYKDRKKKEKERTIAPVVDNVLRSLRRFLC